MTRDGATTFADVLERNAVAFPEKTALIEDAVALTWSMLADRAGRLADALAAAGVGRGDRILWLGQNSFRVYELLCAAAQLGAMVCPANWRWSVAEMRFAVKDFDPAIVFWQQGEIGDVIAETKLGCGDDTLWLRHDAEPGQEGYESFLAAGSALSEPAGSPDDALLVLYTAAIDGRPGGSMLSQSNLMSMAMSTAWAYSVGPHTVFLNSGPMFHIGNFQIVGIPTFVMGGTNVVLRRTDAQAVLDTLAVHRCTTAFLMPTTIIDVITLQREQHKDLSAFRAMGAEAVWAGVVEQQDAPITRAGATGYGQTELTGLGVSSAFGGGTGNAGRPAPGLLIRLLDEQGAEVPHGEVGEICARGDLVHLGYWNRTELNARRFRGAWWHTTDVGRWEPDGTLTFIGTMTRMIKSGAENIFPAEVEFALESHPAVREAAAIGVPNPRMLQDVKAVVVLHQGAEVTEHELIDHCKTRIASYKKPKSIEFVSELPRLGIAKDYAALDERFGGGGYPGGVHLGGGDGHVKTRSAS